MALRTQKAEKTTHIGYNWPPLLFAVLFAILKVTSSQSSDEALAPDINKQINVNGIFDSSILAFGVLMNMAVGARGTSPCRYIWRQNDTIVKNDTAAQYIIQQNILSGANAGIYRVTVENIYGKVRSLPFNLVVKELGLFPNTSDKVVTVQSGKFTVLNMPEISYVDMAYSYTVEWQQNDTQIQIGDSKYYVTLNNNLALLNIPLSFDQSKFRVKFTHQSFQYFDTYSNYFILSVQASSNQNDAPPEFVVLPRNTSVKTGQSAKMECAVNGQPFDKVQINWYRSTSSGRIEITGNKYTFSNNRRLLIINAVDINDGGIYECEGSLTAPTAYSPIVQRVTLTVLAPPTMSSLPPRITKDFQESVVLPCVAQGSPQPQINWFFNDVELVSSNSTRYQINQNGSLSIASVDLPDSGVYQCFGANEAGEAASYTWLVVNSAEPTMLEAPKNTVVAEHQDTAFTCKVKGGPQPTVFWKKGNINVTIGGRIRVTPDQLLIGQVEKTDSGLYSCNAVNIKGAISANATLTVIGRTQIIKPPQNMSRIQSTDATLDCGVYSDPSIPPPVWTWYFYSTIDNQKQNITSGVGNAMIFPDGSLVITNLLGKDSGKYECVVTSAGGNDQRVAILNIIDLPSKPTITNVTLYDQIPNRVLINWTLPYDGDTPIIKFIIASRRESVTGTNIDNPWDPVDSNVNPNLTSTIVRNLLPSRYYRFRIIAVNKVGDSPPSDPAPKAEAIKMPAQPPSAAPLNLFCVAGLERGLNVSWEPPPESFWNGELLGYIIFYKINALMDETERLMNISDKDVRRTVLNNLTPNRLYRVRIAAYNERGPGVNSSDYSVTTQQSVPDAPPGNVTLISPTSTTIRIDWDPPPFKLLNGVNEGYVIDLKQDGYLMNPVIVRFNEDNPVLRQTYLISDLRKYTLYEIQISCRTGAGPGPKSEPQTIRTLEDVPGPISNISVDNISAKSLRVNWRQPLELNGILTGYEVSIQAVNSTDIKSDNRPPNATSHTFTDLMYETKYIISIRAKTKVGFGPARTYEISSGVPPELPGPPTRLAVTNIEARTVLLQFTPGFDGKTSITLWVVEAQVDDTTSWNRVYNISDPTANQITVYNLHPYTRYRLRIIAQNIVDFSVPSDPCNPFQTKQAAPGMPPQEITPRVNSSTSIRIRWRQIPYSEWNGDSLGYRIMYRRWSKDVDTNTTSQTDIDLVRQVTWTTVELINGSSTQEYFLTKLEEWMDYQIKMISFNAVGNSNESNTLSERTDEDVPSASPMNLSPTNTSSTTISLSWSAVPILQQNGNIQGYKVKYTAWRTGAVPQFMAVDGAKTMNVTLTGLFKFTQYSIQILAFTRMGDGVLSNAITIMTAGAAPGPPIRINFPQVNETSATIEWQQPEEPNGIILKYRVSYKQQDEPDTVLQANEKDLAATVFQYTVGGLAAETYYVFSVEAQTEQGWGEAAVVAVYTIANRDRPDPPVNLRIDSSEVLSRSISIVWTPGNNNFGPIRNFTVQYRQRGGNWQTVEGTIKPQLTSYTVKGLLPNTWYSFRVAAFNDIGRSDFSANSNEVQTKPDKPDGSPQNVKIVALTRTSIKITWDPPPESTWNGHPISDIIQYREEETGAFREESIPFGLFNTSLQQLTIGVRYEIQILTANEAGRGPPSILQVFLVGDVAPFAAPSDIKVTNKSSTELEITWKPPSDDTTNGKLIGYKINYWESASEMCVTSNSMQLSVIEPRVVLGNLKPYTIYCSTVQAVNIAGEGPQSVAIPKQTSEDYPGAPENVRFRNVTLRALTILWDAPSKPNGNITHYQLTATTSIDSEMAVTTRVLPGDQRQQHVTDLLEDQRYTFTIVAINSIGNGSVAQASIVTGPQPGSPEAPLQLVVTSKLKTIYLTWTNPDQRNSPILGYSICYLEEGKPNQCTPILDVDHVDPSAQLSLSALKPSTGYSFIVRAINSYGISPPSAPSELFVTPNLLVSKAGPFYTQWWFLVIVALSGVIAILLTITLLCCLHKRRKKGNELKRSTTITTVMSATPEPEENRYPALELRQSTRSVARNGKVQNNYNNIYARSPPRPSPASVTYSEGLNLPTGATAAARKPRVSDDSSVLSEKPSNLGDSSDDVSSDDSDDSSTDSIVKAPVPSSPPPPAFTSHYSRSNVNNNSAAARASSSGTNHHNNKHHNPSSWRLENPHNAYTYTDSEADSSHYAFSLNNGNILVNNVAGARTPLSGFSSFV